MELKVMNVKKTPEISVIIPIYNVEKYIAECLKSVANQTFNDFEVICIDDGSTDNSLDMARRAVEGDSRFAYFTQENAGQSAARNNGLKHAKGEYVIFLDADDYWELNTLQKLITFSKAHDLDDLFFSARTVYEGGFSETDYKDDYDSRQNIEGIYTGKELFVAFAKVKSFAVSPVMQFFKRSFLEKNSLTFPEGIIHEDNLFTCQALIAANRTAFLNEPLYVRRVRQGSTMTQTRTLKHVYGHFKCGYELNKWLLQQGNECGVGSGSGVSITNDFIDALTSHIAFCFDTAACDAQEFDESELYQFAYSLSAAEGVEYRLHVIEHAREVKTIIHEYKDSTTFKVGKAVLKVPMMIKNRRG
ncbi:MAG: glycosyltransferase family 2 protein [Anaerotardibacter sp.]